MNKSRARMNPSARARNSADNPNTDDHFAAWPPAADLAAPCSTSAASSDPDDGQWQLGAASPEQLADMFAVPAFEIRALLAEHSTHETFTILLERNIQADKNLREEEDDLDYDYGGHAGRGSCSPRRGRSALSAGDGPDVDDYSFHDSDAEQELPDDFMARLLLPFVHDSGVELDVDVLLAMLAGAAASWEDFCAEGKRLLQGDGLHSTSSNDPSNDPSLEEDGSLEEVLWECYERLCEGQEAFGGEDEDEEEEIWDEDGEGGEGGSWEEDVDHAVGEDEGDEAFWESVDGDGISSGNVAANAPPIPFPAEEAPPPSTMSSTVLSLKEYVDAFAVKKGIDADMAAHLLTVLKTPGVGKADAVCFLEACDVDAAEALEFVLGMPGEGAA